MTTKHDINPNKLREDFPFAFSHPRGGFDPNRGPVTSAPTEPHLRRLYREKFAESLKSGDYDLCEVILRPLATYGGETEVELVASSLPKILEAKSDSLFYAAIQTLFVIGGPVSVAILRCLARHDVTIWRSEFEHINQCIISEDQRDLCEEVLAELLVPSLDFPMNHPWVDKKLLDESGQMPIASSHLAKSFDTIGLQRWLAGIEKSDPEMFVRINSHLSGD